MNRIHINERLRELRIKSGYTQSQIAKILNIDRSTYSYYEIGKTMPDVSSLLTLAKIFNISISELLADESNPKMMKELSGSGIRMDYISGKKNISHIYELSGTEQELVGIFRTCSENQQKEIIDYFNNIASKR
ncbi:MAG TPA: transcriptional regulator [Ruminococcaceae bacterium]|nr:transcriptional regulator [Oscillospiraceae bacterium]